MTSREVALVDLLDRVLSTGVVIAGDVTIAIADVDLVRVSLRALVSSVSSVMPDPGGMLPVAPDAALPAGPGGAR
ncbi:gas vesicle protein [Dactylosporangium aurantiacum]|uniref:Gas vesicle protein n=1 Tax=Dactylosporangium aurantiacum TaxID=35754 RepID=A0A9Q9IDG4_9ACTN|nr:gas vesicle protein [Dactylosporangium aurantiacum]MDG6107111.1 gas vesicle protein [Dactylosporangium aurantiacum]UWZ51409.1 gas vesicle protein [Dactylosporangium aurantiacum]